MSRSSSRWDFHIRSYVLTMYVRLYWILELVVFHSLVIMGYICKVSVQLGPQYFPPDCSTDIFSCSKQKTGRKQDKNKAVNQERKIKTLLLLPIHLAHHHSAVIMLLLRCCTDIPTLSLCCCSAFAPLLHCCSSVVAPPLLLRCRSAVAPLLLHCRSAAVAKLSLCWRTDIAPVSLHCRSAAVAPAVAT